MDLDFLIDHMKRKLPMSDKVGNAIVAELEALREIKTALAPLVEWWKSQRYDMVTYLPTRLTVYLDAIARLVGE